MLKYEIIIYWSEEDGSFIAEASELLGCVAGGKTYEEAVENIRVVKEQEIHEFTAVLKN